MEIFKSLNLVIRLLQKYPLRLIVVIGFTFLTSIFDGLTIIFLYKLLNSMTGVGSASGLLEEVATTLMSQAGAIFGTGDDVILSCSISLLIAVILKGIFQYLSLVLGSFSAFEIWKDYQTRFFEKVINADIRYFVDKKQGELTYRIDSLPAQVGGLFKLVPKLLVSMFRFVVVGTVLVSLSIEVCMALFVIGCLYYVFIWVISRKVSYPAGRRIVQMEELQRNILTEMVSGIKQIKVFNSELTWINNFKKAMGTMFYWFKFHIASSELPANLLESIAISLLAGVFIYMRANELQDMTTIIPVLGSFAYGLQKLLPTVAQLGSLRLEFSRSLPFLEALDKNLLEQSNWMPSGGASEFSFNNEVEFKNIHFYHGDKKIIDDISFTIKKGQKVALVGTSGGGKSTLADLLIKMYHPDQGAILVDGKELSSICAKSWLNKIGYVGQDPFIFHASVTENITMGSKVDMDRVISVCKMANAHEFVDTLESGYDTLIGDRGVKLSGGQRQRLSIARALYSDPDLVVLDEATSALDNTSEKKVQDALGQISKACTTLTIAHRLSTIQDSDQILVLEKGQVVERGNHDELLDLKGVYYHLHQAQSARDFTK